MTRTITRLAPSPTGALHLGNARTFVVNYLLARQNSWQILMRIEDLDGPRVKIDSAEDILFDLAWLGLTWDEPIVYQSNRHESYRSALKKLIESGHAYPCICSRKDIELAGGAPHLDDGLIAYPGTCREKFTDAGDAEKQTGTIPAWRVAVDADEIEIDDRFAGPTKYNLAELCGDFVIYKKSDSAAYQLAVVIDDAQAGVNAIVRGDDLLDSAARQKHLRELLGINCEIQYWHLPLVLGSDGHRLAKRHGNTRLSYYRDNGTSAEKILGLIGYWSGMFKTPRPAAMSELEELFDINRLGEKPVTFTAADNDFLLGNNYRLFPFGFCLLM